MEEIIFDYSAAVLGFAISLVWLTYKLKWIKWIVKQINKIDPQGIVLPSLSILVLPFLLTYLSKFIFVTTSFQAESKVSLGLADIVSKILPLLTFLLGRYFTLRDERQEIDELRNALLKELWFNLYNISPIVEMAQPDLGFDPKGFTYFKDLEHLWYNEVYDMNIVDIYNLDTDSFLIIKNIYDFAKAIKKKVSQGDNRYDNELILHWLNNDLVPKTRQAMLELNEREAKLLLAQLEKNNY